MYSLGIEQHLPVGPEEESDEEEDESEDREEPELDEENEKLLLPELLPMLLLLLDDEEQQLHLLPFLAFLQTITCRLPCRNQDMGFLDLSETSEVVCLQFLFQAHPPRRKKHL